MRRHLSGLYAGMHVTHSYEFGGDIFDCVPILEQPSVRQEGIVKIATPPPPAVLKAGKPAEAAQSAVQVLASQRDRFGNAMTCAAGSIPMRRITLDQITHFRSLAAFLHKTPDGVAPIPVPMTPQVSASHKYSYAYQYVYNWGGNGSLNLWSPPVATASSETFSLFQHWYVGGAGTRLPGLQTVEVGWQNYPAKYGSQQSRLFVYYTADGYNTTGCYNLDCKGFVQTSNTAHLGGVFSKYSSTGGAQVELPIQVQFYRGNWWIFLNGVAIGYYPASLYRQGQLAYSAVLIEIGAESSGTVVWPPEGSGAWSSTGANKAAYARNLFYLDSRLNSHWSTGLTRGAPSPNCYTVTGPAWNAVSGWGEYFYAGGPGGKGC
jgi:hypothetical protein